MESWSSTVAEAHSYLYTHRGTRYSKCEALEIEMPTSMKLQVLVGVLKILKRH
jgi:hypothetical protein